MHPCPCCGYEVFSDPPGSFEICPICFWEDDRLQLRCPELAGGANNVSLIEAQKNYSAYEAIEERFRTQVRKPFPIETRDPNWFPIVVGKDNYEKQPDGVGPSDHTHLYYWRKNYWRG